MEHNTLSRSSLAFDLIYLVCCGAVGGTLVIVSRTSRSSPPAGSQDAALHNLSTSEVYSRYGFTRRKVHGVSARWRAAMALHIELTKHPHYDVLAVSKRCTGYDTRVWMLLIIAVSVTTLLYKELSAPSGWSELLGVLAQPAHSDDVHVRLSLLTHTHKCSKACDNSSQLCE